MCDVFVFGCVWLCLVVLVCVVGCLSVRVDALAVKKTSRERIYHHHGLNLFEKIETALNYEFYRLNNSKKSAPHISEIILPQMVFHREFVNQKSLRRSVFPHGQYQSAALGLVCINPYC